jgi:hypothetical protein
MAYRRVMTDSTDATADVSSSGRSASNEQSDEESEEAATPRSERSDQKHLQGVEDGCGCAEVWEHLSNERERAAKADDGRTNGGD